MSAGVGRSSSAKKGFFGRLKNEFLYHRGRAGVAIPDLRPMLDAYLRYRNGRTRRKDRDG